MFVSNWESIAGVILTRIDLKSSEKMSDLFSLMLTNFPSVHCIPESLLQVVGCLFVYCVFVMD